ncbi:MAG: hypothetical protein HYT79_10620 [Elusimicrobia bacterium]|nr:hypothetical protein [Elusimicrobiota bacterium]
MLAKTLARNIDINGCNNFNGFDLTTGSLLGWIFKEALALAKKADVSEDQLREKFYSQAENLCKTLRMTISPSDAWKKFQIG